MELNSELEGHDAMTLEMELSSVNGSEILVLKRSC